MLADIEKVFDGLALGLGRMALLFLAVCLVLWPVFRVLDFVEKRRHPPHGRAPQPPRDNEPNF